jgi:salicylate hydroxylase
LGQALERLAAFPDKLLVRSAPSGRELASLSLGSRCQQRYGAPYATLHRADLHTLLLDSVRLRPEVKLHLNSSVTGYIDTPEGVQLAWADGYSVEGDALIGADGLWSQVRLQTMGDTVAQPTGHLAYRALVRQSDLPKSLRSQQVSVWLGPEMHLVSYPVRGGEWLNVVMFTQGQVPEDYQDWDHAGLRDNVLTAMVGHCAALTALVEAVPAWRLWALCDRPPVGSAGEMVRGRVALLGDAAHPMPPYLAQGAGMAIEDAAELGRCLAGVVKPVADVPLALSRYALNRWQRNARVQARAVRNGQIFHATGPLRLGRDIALKLLGHRLLDMPWLYAGA